MFQYLVFPFALHHEAVDLGRVSDRWVGSVQAGQAGLYIDVCCLLIMGGLPWQVRGLAPNTLHRHTHTLSERTPKDRGHGPGFIHRSYIYISPWTWLLTQ